MSSTLQEIKAQENELLKEKSRVINSEKLNKPICSWCDKKIYLEEGETLFYVCELHGNIYCCDCARNNNEEDISYYDAPSCLLKNPFTIINNGREEIKQCIYEKRMTK